MLVMSTEQQHTQKKDERARPRIMLRALKSEAKRIFLAVSGISSWKLFSASFQRARIHIQGVCRDVFTLWSMRVREWAAVHRSFLMCVCLYRTSCPQRGIISMLSSSSTWVFISLPACICFSLTLAPPHPTECHYQRAICSTHSPRRLSECKIFICARLALGVVSKADSLY